MNKRAKLLLGLGVFAYVGVIILTPIVYTQYQSVVNEQKLVDAKRNVAVTVAAFNITSEADVAQALTSLANAVKVQTVKTGAPGQAEFEAQSAATQKAILNLAATAGYSQQIGKLLAGQQYGGKFVSATDAANLAKKWQTLNDALKKLSPPTELQKQQDVLVASTANQVIIATKASDAYKANDAAAIAAQSKASADELAKIKAVYDDVYAYVRAQQDLIVLNAQPDIGQVCKPISATTSAC